MRIENLEEAKKRIKELEKEVERLKAENERLLGSVGGRKKHDDVWMASYNDFSIKYDNGMTIAEIVSEGNISRRTAYRYLKYYRSVKEMHEKGDT
ncbi:MAG: helix-turn-helix domain-containing protein [Lachnospiraceae bacterium]|nr:helix-turn-helix domain-containing protein [Lachnospiraceae bacterium]MBP5703024.1 helix-turn-helix domain-containing protein [Lachnospiraceae bacterium]MBP5762605.1 helix-turn-helix domain-containing protein [Lachnospiraceae bacterium]